MLVEYQILQKSILSLLNPQKARVLAQGTVSGLAERIQSRSKMSSRERAWTPTHRHGLAQIDRRDTGTANVSTHSGIVHGPA